ncbi:hypothetical protein D3C86_1573390 [compost metagenome]
MPAAMPYISAVNAKSAFICNAATEIFARSIYAIKYSSMMNGISLKFIFFTVE